MPTEPAGRSGWRGGSVLRRLGALAGAVLAGWLLWRIRTALVPFLVAAGMSFLLAPLVSWGERRGLGRPWAVILVYALLAVLAAGAVAFALPVVRDEVRELLARIPGYAAMLDRAIAHWRGHYTDLRLPDPLREAVDGAAARAELSLTRLLGAWADGLGGLAQLALVLALAPVISYYLLADLPRMRAAVLRWLPPERREDLIRLGGELDAVLSGYVRGQVLLALAIAVLASAAFLLLRLPFAILLGIVSGLGELVPYFGPFVAAVPAVAVGLMESPGLAAAVVVAVLVIQQIESAFLGPYIMHSTLGIHPLGVIFGLLAGAELGGVAGAVLALPVMAVGLVAVRFLVRTLTH